MTNDERRKTTLTLHLLPGEFAVCRLDGIEPPVMPADAPFWVLARTADETSLVCAASNAPAGARTVSHWRCFKVAGPFDFDVVGVLADLSRCLAEASISLFVISTFDTDYLLVREPQLKEAVDALESGGHTVELS